MLFAQHRARAEDRRLSARQNAQIRRAQSDFGFSEPHVAAKQAVHDLRRAHVGKNFAHRNALVGRILVRKRRLELVHFFKIVGKNVAFLFAPLGVKRFEIERHFFERRAHARFHPFKLAAADLG